MVINKFIVFNELHQCCCVMLSYFLKCRKDTENINPRVLKTKNNKTIILSKCAICSNQKSKFIKTARSKWNIK